MICINNKIVKNLTEDLLKPKYRGSKNRFLGHCYVATEAAFHLYAKDMGYKPQIIKINNDTHWFLKKDDDVIDITKNQFKFKLDYVNSRGCGFLTKEPSKRCKILISRLCI